MEKEASRNKLNIFIHQLVENHVDQNPHSVAIALNDQVLTYQELNEKANQLAHYLKNIGVKPELLIGICVERSLDMLVSILGVLKAGCAYVPIIPEYPKERINHMLTDSKVSILLTHQALS